ncbi:hypothetical protein [Coprobacillus sp. AF33-1AC]|uniref:hypothetical protein n=1 Tax=Coprobacillus sp. AF33-1AC TaxID=2292032 RepID=UPI000E53F1B5|nr:hypothetical protein [Coprobacillus sp. AF33-1AC]RHM59670.1 hypothetical protein DWZ53_08990 [Coprobacillus sp. AF33-1AC]
MNKPIKENFVTNADYIVAKGGKEMAIAYDIDYQEYANALNKYCDQLEKELEECKRKRKTKQVVARTFPNGWKPRTQYLEEFLNQGYHVVMANHINDKDYQIIEYILEKEIDEDE